MKDQTHKSGDFSARPWPLGVIVTLSNGQTITLALADATALRDVLSAAIREHNTTKHGGLIDA